MMLLAEGRVKEVQEALKEDKIRDKYKTLVAGGPVTARWTNRIGADIYAEDASVSVGLGLVRKALGG